MARPYRLTSSRIRHRLPQADGTAWMAFYCVVMLDIALELAEVDPTYEDMASKFFEHFIHIMDAINSAGQGEGAPGGRSGGREDTSGHSSEHLLNGEACLSELLAHRWSFRLKVEGLTMSNRLQKLCIV